jgi:demethylmenaquinone methyltransferase / 2-methoxy-6-polyprenyl-1,4-benzoquinol methylase
MKGAPLRRAFDSPDAKQRYVRRLFATIAPRYDLITRILSFGLDGRWKVRLIDLAEVKPGSRLLDLACGTGDLTFEGARRGAAAVGLDITSGMIELARVKPGGARVSWLVGDMAALPIADGSFDIVTTGYGLRNTSDLSGALADIHRVLRPGGVLCSLDFDRPERPPVRGVYLTYLTAVGSTLGFVLHGDPDTYRYIPESIRRYPGAKAVCGIFRAHGFASCEYLPVLGGLMAIHRAVRTG